MEDADDDIVMPEGPPPDEEEVEDSDDDIPMPEGPPPPRPGESPSKLQGLAVALPFLT